MPAKPPSMINSFMAQLDQPGQLLELFEFLPHVHLFVKDTQSRFVKVNACSLAMHGCKAMSEIIGRTDYDFHPPTLAAQYIAEDQQVMASGKPLCNQVWLVLDHERTPRWYLSTKLPLFGRDGKAIGIGGVMRSFEHAGPSPRDYHRLTPVMEYVLANYSQHISLPDLAQCAHLSVSQLQREFKKLFSTSPGEYLLKVRLLSARRRLEETTDPLGVIAAECGFYDPSHFTRAFTAQIGMPPLAYRRRFQRPA